MEEKYTWNLKDVYQTEEDIEKDYQKVIQGLEKIKQFEGKIGETSDTMYQCIALQEEIEEIATKLYSYSRLRHDLNKADAVGIKLLKRMEDLVSRITTAFSFIMPEMVMIKEETVEKYIAENEALRHYERIIRDIMDEKKHILTPSEETILANYAEILEGFESVYNMLTDVDISFEPIYNEKGEQLPVTHATLQRYLTDLNRDIRKQAYKSEMQAYENHIHTITELYLNYVKKSIITARLRKYDSALQRAVKSDDSTVEVYNKLIESVHDNLAINHRYLALKKQLLQLEEMHGYDLFVNPFIQEEVNIEYEEGVKTVKEALQPMGEEYLKQVEYAFTHRWIDVYERENKNSGGYNMRIYGVHPYILLNYNNTAEEMSTIIHEMGHAMHSYYAANAQTFYDSQYTIMTAEVASTVNEIILGEYLLSKETDPLQRAKLLDTQINRVRSTLVSQTLLAEFEKIVHDGMEQGENYSADDLNRIYFELSKMYHGEAVNLDEISQYSWARIPHFYLNFYVYKYATGIASAITIARKILAKEEGYVERYIEMLKKGGSIKSLDLLRTVDVDLESKAPVENAFAYYKEKLDELEKIIKDHKKL